MKAILVIDTPDKCNRCPLYIHPQYCGAEFYNHKEVSKYGTNKPNWCPLRPLPDSKKVIVSGKVKVVNYLYANGFADGFNACLDEITGKKNE